jgi:hypothetical protein
MEMQYKENEHGAQSKDGLPQMLIMHKADLEYNQLELNVILTS